MTQPQDPFELNEKTASQEYIDSTSGNSGPPTFVQPNTLADTTTVQFGSESPQPDANHDVAPAYQAFETGKATVSDAVTTLKQLHQDPNQGILGALNALGENRAFNVGIALCLLFPLAVWGAIVRGISSFLSFWGGLAGIRLFELDILAHLKGLLASSIPAIALILGLMALKALFKTRGTAKQFTYLAGICLLPLSINFSLLWLLGGQGLELSGLLGIFSCSVLVLLLNSSLTSVMGFSTKKALWLVPTLLVAVVFFTQVTLQILY